MADPLPVVPARENLRTVVESNTLGGRVSGDETVSIDSLFGDISSSQRAQDTVTDIMSQMSGPKGYIERLLVDQDGNVIEGAHRLEALRRLGISEVPITRVVDPTANLDLPSMRKAIEGAGKIPSDHVNQIMSQVGDMLESTGNDPEKVFEEFTFPEGYEKYFGAALDSVANEPRPKDPTFAEGPFIEIEGAKQPSLITTEGKAPEFLYRVVSQQEYDKAQETGSLSPSSFYERIHASSSPELQYSEPGNNVLLKIRYSPEDEWYSKYSGDKIYGVTRRTIPFSRVETLASGSPSGIRPKDQPRAPLLLEGPSEDKTGKEPSKGRMFRGIGSLMRGRMFPIIRAAQAGWETLSPEARAEIEDYLKRPAHELFGMDKPGIEYFKELLGISPEKIDAYHGTTAEFDAFEFLHGSGGDLGFHFGTSKQAKDRLKETTQYSPPEKRAKGKILSAELTLGKTLETPDMPSFEEWNSPRSVAKLLLGTRWGETRQKELSSIVSEANALNQKIDDIFEAEDESLLALDFWENLREMDVKGRMGLLSKVRDLMKADGYEGIKYVNEYEDPESRSYSYVVFDPANIRIKDEGETIQLPGPPQTKAAGGFIDKPLYDDQRMVG